MAALLALSPKLREHSTTHRHTALRGARRLMNVRVGCGAPANNRGAQMANHLCMRARRQCVRRVQPAPARPCDWTATRAQALGRRGARRGRVSPSEGAAAMDKKVITLETGWADMEAGIAKLIRFLEGDEGEVIGVEQYMHLYTYVRARGGRARASGAQGRGAKGRSERRVTSPRRVSKVRGPDVPSQGVCAPFGARGRPAIVCGLCVRVRAAGRFVGAREVTRGRGWREILTCPHVPCGRVVPSAMRLAPDARERAVR